MAYLLPKYVVSPSLFVFELFSCYFQVFGAILGGIFMNEVPWEEPRRLEGEGLEELIQK